MISLQILDVKSFMSKLLMQDIFDSFLLSEATITTYNTFHIDGHLNKEYYAGDESIPDELKERNASLWKQVKPFCFELVKGKRTPLSFKIVFQLSALNTEKLLSRSGISLRPDEINGLFLNLKYDGNKLHCITGTSIRTFSLDKTLEQAWDIMVQKFFSKQEILYEAL